MLETQIHRKARSDCLICSICQFIYIYMLKQLQIYSWEGTKYIEVLNIHTQSLHIIWATVDLHLVSICSHKRSCTRAQCWGKLVIGVWSEITKTLWALAKIVDCLWEHVFRICLINESMSNSLLLIGTIQLRRTNANRVVELCQSVYSGLAQARVPQYTTCLGT